MVFCESAGGKHEWSTGSSPNPHDQTGLERKHTGNFELTGVGGGDMESAAAGEECRGKRWI